MAIRYAQSQTDNVDTMQYSTVHIQNKDVPGTYTIAGNIDKLFDVQRPNNFELLIEDLNGLKMNGSSPIEREEATVYGNAEDVLRLTVYSSSIPHFSQNPIEIQMGNNSMKFAGVPKFDSGSIKAYDTIGPDTKGILMAWQNMAYDVKTQKVGLAGDYKKKAILYEYTPDWQPIRSWVLHGCWISNLSEQAADWSGSGNKTVDVTIQYDYAEIDFNGTAPGISSINIRQAQDILV